MSELKTALVMLQRVDSKLSIVEPQGAQEMSLLIRKIELEKRINDLIYYEKLLEDIHYS